MAWKTVAIRWAIIGAVIGLIYSLVIGPALNPGISGQDLGARTLGAMLGQALVWMVIGLIGTKIVRALRGPRSN